MAPVFFAFTLGMIEVGRAVMVQQILTTASREGARQAVLDGATQTAVTTFITSLPDLRSCFSGKHIRGLLADLPTASGYNGPVTVTVSVTFQSSELVTIANLS